MRCVGRKDTDERLEHYFTMYVGSVQPYAEPVGRDPGEQDLNQFEHRPATADLYDTTMPKMTMKLHVIDYRRISCATEVASTLARCTHHPRRPARADHLNLARST